MDERELEERLRAGLAVHAEDADTTAPVVARARADVGRRRRTRWSTVAAAAAVVVVAGGVSVATVGDRDTGTPTVDESPTAVDGVESWRTEYWADVAVDVPADWGYGGAPMSSRPTPVACYPAAMVLPGGERPRGGEDPGRGWVGRPIGLTDVCAGYPWIEHSPQEEPTAPYVWLGAAVEPGVVDYANGYTQETVEVNGSTVTVATDDPALRERILSTARGGETCMSNVASIPRPKLDLPDEGLGQLLRAEVCAYGRQGTADFWLTYAQELSGQAVEASFDAAAGAPEARSDCDYQPHEFVVIRAYYDDPLGGAELERSVVVESGCGGTAAIAGGPTRRLTPDAVEPWTRNGIPAVVHGPGDARWVYDYFIGPQG